MEVTKIKQTNRGELQWKRLACCQEQHLLQCKQNKNYKGYLILSASGYRILTS